MPVALPILLSARLAPQLGLHPLQIAPPIERCTLARCPIDVSVFVTLTNLLNMLHVPGLFRFYVSRYITILLIQWTI